VLAVVMAAVAVVVAPAAASDRAAVAKGQAG